jgi:predicted nucleotidyltransferase
MINPALKLPLAAISQVCRNHRIKTLALFGSAIHEDFRADSDVDFLVEFAPDAEPGLTELFSLQQELERLVGHPVDLVERKAVEQSRNYIRRHHILRQVEPVYVA